MLSGAKRTVAAVGGRLAALVSEPLGVAVISCTLGLALVAIGLALVYPPAAFCVVGVVLFTLGLLVDIPKVTR